MTRAPSFSVLVPAKNAEQWLVAALESISAQSFEDFEIVAIDDHSEDATGTLLRDYARRDPRLRIFRSPISGIAHALNEGLSRARSNLVARMDADDLMLPGRLQNQFAALQQEPNLDVVAGGAELFPPGTFGVGMERLVAWQNTLGSHDEIVTNLLVEAPFVHPAVSFRRQTVVDAGGYRQGPFPEDYELWLRLAARGATFQAVSTPVVRWRQHPEQTSRIDPRCTRSAFDQLRSQYVAHWVPTGRDLAVWGAGRRSRVRARSTGLAIDHWVDVDPRLIGKALDQRPVHHFETLRDREPRPFVLIYVNNHGAREEISAWLEGAGYRCGEDYLAVG